MSSKWPISSEELSPESALKKGCSDFFGLFCPILRVGMFFGSFPSSDLIADKGLETEKKQNEAKLKRGRVYYEKIKDHTKSSLPIVFVSSV